MEALQTIEDKLTFTQPFLNLKTREMDFITIDAPEGMTTCPPPLKFLQLHEKALHVTDVDASKKDQFSILPHNAYAIYLKTKDPMVAIYMLPEKL